MTFARDPLVPRSRHRVYLPGPFARPGRARVEHHGEHCQGEPCEIQHLFDARTDNWQVQGFYWTEDGKSFERCAFQPTPT